MVERLYLRGWECSGFDHLGKTTESKKFSIRQRIYHSMKYSAQLRGIRRRVAHEGNMLTCVCLVASDNINGGTSATNDSETLRLATGMGRSVGGG